MSALLRTLAAAPGMPDRWRAAAAVRAATPLAQSTDIDAALRVLLDAADRCAPNSTESTALLGRAAATAFDRSLHYDGTTSPLADDPDRFLAPFRDSTAWQRLISPRGRAASASPRPTGPLRVVAVTDADRRFLDPLIAAAQAADPEVSVRVIELQAWAADRGLTLPLTPGDQVTARRDPSVVNEPWARALAAELADADVVWVEWCQRAAVLVSLLDPGTSRVAVRLHSFEAFSVFPHLVDPSRINTLVTVSPALASLAAAVVSPLAGAGRDVRTIPLALDLVGIDTVKEADADRTLGLVGWAAPAKDAVWALDLLAVLRADDPAWRLRLIGPAPRTNGSAGEARYAQRVTHRMSQPDVAGAVDRVGEVEGRAAVSEQLRHVGVIVSSSARESFHQGLAEGVASGALPVVRNWPMLAAYGGPHGLWPEDWIVDTPERAAERIRRAQSAPADRNDALLLPNPVDVGAAVVAVLRG